jgi:predicted DNA-binding transcriptional regulator AlpA
MLQAHNDDLPLFMTWENVMESANLCRLTIKRMIATGDFPAPVLLSPKVQRFFTEDYLDWLEDRSVNHRVQFEEQTCAGHSLRPAGSR